ncbi:MAG: hypothetical protein O2955_17480 [Planctomycetota bacterium]|nr:hypothetical protein [Planctomycetota bacterium]MDA1214303.1 hypothetical protein [Planctomycetota bacterium]
MTLISATSSFMKIMGEIIADIQRMDIAEIDLELLKLKHAELSDRFDIFKSELERKIIKQKSHVEQDLNARGLSNTTMRYGLLRAVETQGSDELAKAAQEYNRAIEVIALLERKVNTNKGRWWKRAFGDSFGFFLRRQNQNR